MQYLWHVGTYIVLCSDQLLHHTIMLICTYAYIVYDGHEINWVHEVHMHAQIYLNVMQLDVKLRLLKCYHFVEC